MILATIVRAKAPARISFSGGGTDVEPYMSLYGGCVISSTINKYSYVSISDNDSKEINIRSLDLRSSVQYSLDVKPLLDGELDLAKISIQKFIGSQASLLKGLDVLTMSEVPPGSGLGTSSTMMVALIEALQAFTGSKLGKYEIAHLAYKFEREELGLNGGYQDQYAATFGGFNFIEFSREGVLVTPLRLRKDTINELEVNLLLCYTGRNHISANIITEQQDNVLMKKPEALEGMHMQARLAREMRDVLLKGDIHGLGEKLNEAWRWKKAMATKISDSFIDALYGCALTHGAIGGKLLGAGGGGYLLLMVPPNRQLEVKDALCAMGGQFDSFNFEFEGSQAWSVGTSEVYSKLASQR